MTSLVKKQEVMQPIKIETFFGKHFHIYGTQEKPLLLAKEVAEMIEYDLTSINKLLASIDEDEKLNGTILRAGQSRNMWFVTEHGLYEILFQSRKPIAKQFKKQVKIILEKMRTGQLVRNNIPQTYSEALRLAADLAEEKEQLLLENKDIKESKEYREITTKQEGIKIGEFARTLYGKCGIKIGRNNLFETLRDMQILRCGAEKNQPYQRYLTQGYFKLSVKRLDNGKDVFTTFITPKGQTWLYKQLKIKFGGNDER